MAKPVTRFLSGIHPYDGSYYKFTIYQDDSIRIERPWCCRIRHCEMPTIEEQEWKNHKHLVWLVERHTITEKRY